jgi:hypothetical protein
MRTKESILAAGMAAIVFLTGLSLMSAPAADKAAKPFSLPKTAHLSLNALKDKVKGGWAGQTIGCTFGGPTEFGYQGTIIHDYQPIPWSDASIATAFKFNPGLYDDVYMDLTLVEIFKKEGLDAPAASFAKAFAGAEYPLWHANQMARYNILRGLLPPLSGDWRNNPHADDIDFQIESDFAGLMSPGLPNTAADICDKVGHIMNFGDGWYGGVYVAAMYSLAFVSSDIEFIVEEALKTIPPETTFARTMSDVIQGHGENPADWKTTWFRVLKRWGDDVGCPEGVFSSFDIDAKMNCAWVVLGLLYGGGDFGRTIDISARCGDDSDCNPATAGGILGTMLGYEKISEAWKKGLADIDRQPFPYTTLSLQDVYRLSAEQALENIRRNGGRVGANDVELAVQAPKPVKTEVSFPGHFPVEKRRLGAELRDSASFAFDGIGFAVNGEALCGEGQKYVLKVEMTIDGGKAAVWDLPTEGLVRNPTPFWAYSLRSGRHEVRFKVLNPEAKARVRLDDVIIYSDAPRGTKGVRQ